MRRRAILRLSAGQIDTGLNSLATLGIGLYAVGGFDARTLGVYAVLFTAWNFARAFPTELVFLPSEVVAVSRPEPARILIVESSLKRGAPVSLLSGAGLVGASLLVRGDTSPETLLGLTATATVLAMLSPAQDHLRRMFHISGASWSAAAVAAAHLIVTVAAIVVLHDRVAVHWIPFGSLALGMVASLAVALALARRLAAAAPLDPTQPGWAELRAMGGWLLVSNLVAEGSDFALALIVKSLIGAEFLGYAEGARVVSRPVAILGMGLVAVLGPRSMEAGANRDQEAAARPRLMTWYLSLAGGLAYLTLVGFDWALNPVSSLLPNAYAVGGLVPVAIVGNIVLDVGLPWRAELMGARLQPLIARVEILASLLQVATSFLAKALLGFTLPVAWTVGWMTRAVGFRAYSRTHFSAAIPQRR